MTAAVTRPLGPQTGKWHGPMEELLSDFVAEPKKVVNTLTNNRVYSKVGSNTFFEVSPPIVHFGGYVVGQTHRQVVRIINCSGCSRRVTVIPPATPFFSVHFTKKGLLAPGMAEELTVEFRPQEWQYYHDVIKLHTEDENLIVPLHGYPVLNQVVFPKRVDLGYCDLGDCRVREVRLECEVPIQFEFELTVANPLPELSISPSKGLVPANGHVSIQVRFAPARPMTYSIDVQVRVAQFNFVPFVATIVGTGVTGETRTRLLLEELERDVGPGSPTGAAQSPSLALETLKKALKPKWSGGGAGGGDAFTRAKAKADRETARLQRSTGAAPKAMGHVADDDEVEEEIDGLRLPYDLNSHAAVSYVLQQQPGKLRIKDLKAAIERQRQDRARMQAVTASGKASGRAGLGVLDDAAASAQVKRAVFEAELKEKLRADREKELRFCVALGEDLLTEAQIEAVKRARLAAAAAQDELTAAEARERRAVAVNRDGQRATRVLGEDLLRGHVPDWNVYKSDTWHKRAQALEKFIHTVRTVIYRNRAQRRLSALQSCIREAGGTSSGVAALVDGSRSTNPALNVGGFNESVSAILDTGRWVIQDGRFPDRREEGSAREYAPVEVPEVAEFDALEPLPLKEPLRCNLMGYKPQPFPPISSHVPLMQHQPLLGGAEEENFLPGPAYILPPSVADHPLPDVLKPLNPASIPATAMLDPPALAPMLPSWGRDLDHLIRPVEQPYHDSLTSQEVGSASAVALLPGPTSLSGERKGSRVWGLRAVAAVPPLMTGPDARDAMSDPKEEAEPGNGTERLLPTAEEIRREFFLPPARFPATLNSEEGGSAEGGSGRGGGEGTEASAGQARLVFPNLKAEAELNTLLAGRREGSVAALRNRTMQMNSLLKDPRQKLTGL
ncbi:hypothetical protein KFL_000800340 [Klebsormidium nitens]|uniref:Uncharacterized protein n=1 Tax=Klebsormidium nitens TaxID=105231 RepID=A0A1Y1HY41_KLENI|nr:hypothetical protein KFL_000800340 [Klebsormidium nitens]|eukprot:GAQ81457.1 hypothetical protein KFL_000800340 [Klebsormidium nitens]